MKINKIFLVGIILLTVITIGAVSAAEDIGALTDDNDDSLSTTDEIDLQTADDAVISEDKKTWEIDPTNNKEELNVSSLSINFGNSAPLKYNDDGEITNADEFSLMIDGKPHEIDYMDTGWFSVDINDLALGEHNYVLNFAGNDEYLPANGTGTFKVCDVVVEIPDKYVYGEQLDCSVVVSTPTDAGTTVGVTINGKTITKKIEYEYYYEENHGTYQVTYLSLKEFNLACGVHDLTVTLDGKTIRNGKITVDYNLPYDSYSEPYGEDQFTLYVLDDMDEAKVTVKIDGKVASLSHIRTIPDMKFLAVSLPKNFAAGNHNLTVSYAGDKKYPARTFNTTLRIEPTLVAPYRVPEGTGGFTLKMPEDAKGNLIIFINSGDTDFQNLLKYNEYIDKSELLIYTNKFINTNQKYICISRPRRFGKTIAVNMVASYYDISGNAKKIFKNLKIIAHSSFQIHANNYIVIKINIQNILSISNNISELIEKIKCILLDDLKKQYGVELYSDDINNFLGNISKKMGRSFVFVIDEWDCLLREYVENIKWQKEYLDFLRYLFKDQSHIALVYMTGILPTKKYGTHSALNMFNEFSMVNADVFAEFVGFTATEVEDLCLKYRRNFTECKKWYTVIK